MEDVLYVWINKSKYTLYSHNDVTWRLFNFDDRYALRKHSAHTLKYWRKKGVIQREEENKDQRL